MCMHGHHRYSNTGSDLHARVHVHAVKPAPFGPLYVRTLSDKKVSTHCGVLVGTSMVFNTQIHLDLSTYLIWIECCLEGFTHAISSTHHGMPERRTWFQGPPLHRR